MKALVLEGPATFVVKSIPIPKPHPGQVLIKVIAAPINPSDTIFIKRGVYSDAKKTPCTAGF
jgi:NADPH2:quinone reductase